MMKVVFRMAIVAMTLAGASVADAKKAQAVSYQSICSVDSEIGDLPQAVRSAFLNKCRSTFTKACSINREVAYDFKVNETVYEGYLVATEAEETPNRICRAKGVIQRKK